ncbi:MAG: S41 family peptidase [Pseudomonadota bacterium]
MKKLSPRPRKITAKSYSAGAMIVSACGGALVCGAILSSGFAKSMISADTFQQLDLFGEVFEQVHENYVSPPDDGDLIKGAIDGMLLTLDPHSNYLTSDAFQTMQEQTRGSFAGLGIQVTMDTEGDDKGYVKIIAPIDDTPAAKAGLKTDDLIVEIDGKQVLGMSIDEAISHLKGEKGTRVDIKVLRNREEDPFDVTIVRDIVKVQSVVHRAEGDFGYIRVATFSEQTYDGLKKAVRKLKKEIPGGPKGLVLDLRSNPGGLLDQAVAVADAFLEGGEIVSTRGRRPRDTLREMGRAGDLLDEKPIVVLINGGSASASEIVAGALQDRGRALLLGTKSFGKGSVQTVIPLQNGLQGALRLTTAKYYTPSGRSIQATGIVPDIRMPVVYEGQEDFEERPGERDLPNALAAEEETRAAAPTEDELSAADETELPPVEPFMCGKKEDGSYDDCQLNRALEILSDATEYRQLLANASATATQ